MLGDRLTKDGQTIVSPKLNLREVKYLSDEAKDNDEDEEWRG